MNFDKEIAEITRKLDRIQEYCNRKEDIVQLLIHQRIDGTAYTRLIESLDKEYGYCGVV